jgi:hypothetical protein
MPNIAEVRGAVYAWIADPESTVDTTQMWHRFWSHTPARQYVETDECILWQGAISTQGYGIFSIKGVLLGAHRVAYRLAKGAIPSRQTIDHCRRLGCSTDPTCVNPRHLEVISRRGNTARRRDLAVFT